MLSHERTQLISEISVAGNKISRKVHAIRTQMFEINRDMDDLQQKIKRLQRDNLTNYRVDI